MFVNCYSHWTPVKGTIVDVGDIVMPMMHYDVAMTCKGRSRGAVAPPIFTKRYNERQKRVLPRRNREWYRICARTYVAISVVPFDNKGAWPKFPCAQFFGYVAPHFNIPASAPGLVHHCQLNCFMGLQENYACRKICNTHLSQFMISRILHSSITRCFGVLSMVNFTSSISTSWWIEDTVDSSC